MQDSHKTENQQKERNEKKNICRNGCPQRNDPNSMLHEQYEGLVKKQKIKHEEDRIKKFIQKLKSDSRL
ncbi:hypothetical protein LSS_07914 [Leptospira santarosai serovar Shermani str. LT 821]|uniref:Uncharacterized protein n=1 Tax=Leptospira santarosai serovar Shermani str. LT 821 TaxID=758847 RepID=K8YCK3_9LEPT|nr:hypothetical protein LSS_07914 [Leptospira santarosai serovar Shermani str. LT 821]